MGHSTQTILDALHSVASAPSPVHTGCRPGGASYFYRVATIKGELGVHRRAANLVVQAGLKPVPAAKGKRRFVFDLSTSSITTASAGVSGAVGRFIYAQRWRIEDFFRRLPDSRPRCYSKTIQHHVVHFGAFVMTVAFAAVLKFLYNLQGQTWWTVPAIVIDILGGHGLRAYLPTE